MTVPGAAAGDAIFAKGEHAGAARDIIAGVGPYVLLLIAGLALVPFFPVIALWLPGSMNFR